MRIYDETKDICMKNTAVTLGKFDALHLGHQKLIENICNEKKMHGYKTVLFSFDTLPLRHQKALITKNERIHICEKSGIDNLVFYPVNEFTMSMEPEDFIRLILVEMLDAKIVVTGKDFRFGKDRRGDIEMLKLFSNKFGYKLIVSDSVMFDKEKVSSSSIKEYLSSGNVEKANKMLGYNYFILGEVVKGKQIGRTIDTRTINVIPDTNKLLPPKGVYKTNTIIKDKSYKSITNIGINPTVKNDESLIVETHILNFDENIYNMDVKIELLRFIREEKKFSNLEELKRQILLDISEANL